MLGFLVGLIARRLFDIVMAVGSVVGINLISDGGDSEDNVEGEVFFLVVLVFFVVGFFVVGFFVVGLLVRFDVLEDNVEGDNFW